jgi:hypothetical protein
VIWGDEAKTINLGTFDVIDTQPTEGVSGFGTFAVTQSGEWIVEVSNPTDVSELATEETLSNIETILTNPLQVTPTVFPDFNIPNHNRRELSYTGNNLTGVVYKNNGVTVATLTLGYTDNVLISVERS